MAFSANYKKHYTVLFRSVSGSFQADFHSVKETLLVVWIGFGLSFDILQINKDISNPLLS